MVVVILDVPANCERWGRTVFANKLFTGTNRRLKGVYPASTFLLCNSHD